MMNKEIETKTSFASFQLFSVHRQIIVFLMNSFYYYDFTMQKKLKRTFFFIFNLQVYSMQWWMVAMDRRLGNCCYLFLSSAKVERMRFSFTFFCFSSVCLKRSCVQLVWRNSQMVKKKTLVPTAQVYLICKQAQTNLNPTKKI